MKSAFACFTVLLATIATTSLAAEPRPAAPAVAAERTIECCFPAQVVVDKDSSVVVITKDLSAISASSIDPPDDISVKSIQEQEVGAYDKKQGKRRWLLTFTATKKAAVGERHLQITGPEGVSEKKVLRVIPYVPEVKAINILKANKERWTIDFALTVAYPGKTLGEKPELAIQVICGRDAIFTLRKPDKISAGKKNTFEVRAAVDNPGPGAHCEGTGEISVGIESESGHRSERLAVPVEFR